MFGKPFSKQLYEICNSEEDGKMTSLLSFPFYAVLQQRYSPEFLFGSESLYISTK